jgi:phosphoribosyl 1,2-cyclic phosphate phosphodiesterase
VKLTFLGTGTSQGVPVIACNCQVCQSNNQNDKRLRTSALIEMDGVNILIDAGPDFRQQMLSTKVQQLDAILLTHEHRDHVAGLDDVRAFNFIHQRPMDIWAELRVQNSIKSNFDYIFADVKYPGSPEIILHTINGEPFEIEGVKITPIRAYHFKMPVYGFRIGDITYLTDANSLPNEEMEKIRGSKCIVINALRKKEHISHFTLSQALNIIAELKPEKAYITHISHQLGLSVDVQAELPDNVFLAYDGLTIKI